MKWLMEKLVELWSTDCAHSDWKCPPYKFQVFNEGGKLSG